MMTDQTAWHEHAPFGFWLIDALRPRKVVELGVHTGFSYFVFCQAAQRLGIPAQCFGIDTWRGDEQAGFYDGDDVYHAACEHNRRYQSFSQLIRSNFKDALGQFAEGSIDLLHIDGFHSYEAARRDFDAWLPKMSERGVVMLHDTAEYGEGFGVYRVWEELSARYPSFEFRHGHGLGVLGVGAQTAEPMRALFQASIDPAQQHMVRSAYERLGASITGLLKLDEQGREIETLSKYVRQLEQDVHAEHARGAETVAKHKIEIQKLRAYVRQLEQDVQAEHARGAESVDEQKSEIEKLRAYVRQLETELRAGSTSAADGSALEQIYSSTHDKILHLESIIEAHQRSISWRITAPLRALAGFVKSLR